MKTGDSLKAAWSGLTHALKTDLRTTIDERAALTAIDAILDGGGDTTKPQDMVVVEVMKKFCIDSANY